MKNANYQKQYLARYRNNRLKKVDYLIEIGAYEIINDNLTGDQFHIYIRPRLIMEERIVHIHGINNNFMMIIIKMYT